MNVHKLSLPARAGAPRFAWRNLVVPALIVVLCVAMAVWEPRFFSRFNLVNLARNFAMLALVSVGQMLVMVVGGIDLSLGAVVALASVASALTMTGVPALWPDASPLALVVIGTLAALLAGAAVGAANGAIVAWLKVPPFISTIGVMSMVGGAALYISNGVPIYGVPDLLTDAVGRALLFGVPVIVWICLAVVLAIGYVMTQRPLGRHLYAVGGRPEAARASGIPMTRLLLLAYTTAGVLAALYGVLVTARIGSGQATLGNTTAIESIAAAVVGGVSLQGGSGRVGRVVAAALFLAVVSNALNMARIDSKWQTLALGVVVIVAMLIDVKTSGKAK
ncbi:ABC transporter permease [Paraburkholderia acidisoli]|uniref:ABC transporter permease n=1 Tax=Paraburkholderia acidisoli TaxID=2571748 RepID=A0A7Z2GM88_9BURK|nr:ABC transporter permease [Paraburkholderia acidisoli]QGZ64273.1 ABC transporter permease [Paraburkholderia acidisoli]